jgi:uncharacterized protein YgiM (DUF1202 family)
MRVEYRFLISQLLLGILILGCSTSEDGVPISTQSSEGVISTAKAYAELTLQATFQTPPPTPSPTISLDTPTSIPTATPDIPIVTAIIGANVRSGPSEEYSIIDLLFEGDTAEVVGRYDNIYYEPETWWLIKRIGEGKDGWIWSGVVSISGDVDEVPILIPPPIP